MCSITGSTKNASTIPISSAPSSSVRLRCPTARCRPCQMNSGAAAQIDTQKAEITIAVPARVPRPTRDSSLPAAVGGRLMMPSDRKDPQHDEPGIPRVTSAVAAIGQAPVCRDRYVLHRYRMIDVAADDADLPLVASDDDVAVPGEMARRQLLILQRTSAAREADKVARNRRILVRALGNHRPA